jgi:hypothetical protein
MFFRRQQRLRVLEALERRAKGFRTDEDLYPLRVPREPVPLDDVIAQAVPGESHTFDPLTLLQRTLLHLAWDDGSAWELWVLVLPSGLKLFCDSGEEGARVLASAGRHASDETDRQFLQLLSESGGQHFGIEMSGGAPSRVRTSITDRGFLVEVFLHLFEIAGTEDSVRSALPEQEHDLRDAAVPDGRDFRADVERWLSHTLRGG